MDEINDRDRQTFLLAMYREQSDQARHHETLRNHASVLLLTLAGGALTLLAALVTLTFGKVAGPLGAGLVGSFALIGLFVLFLGWFGHQLSLRHYVRNRQHAQKARLYRELAEDLHRGRGYDRASTKSKYDEYVIEATDGIPKIQRGSVYRYWAGIFALVQLLGTLAMLLTLALAIYLYATPSDRHSQVGQNASDLITAKPVPTR